MRWLAPFCLLLLPAPAAAEPDLRLAIAEGRNQNHFVREGAVAAHAVLRSGPQARLVFAFPAGNSGAGLWFNETVRWRLAAPLQTAFQQLPDGRLRRGIVAEIEADISALTIERALIGSVRVLRDHGYGNPIPAEVETVPRIAARKIIWERPRLDGGAGYAMVVSLLNGTAGMRDGALVLASDEGHLRLRITALTGDEPLSPLTIEEIFRRPDRASQLQNAFAFLAYREKLLAGSWRFNTYFGRDTLMTLALMMGELKPAPIEAGLASVLERLNSSGEVAHEEDIGEFALIGRPGHDARLPVLDYKMVDDDFMLAPVLAAYLLDTAEGRERGPAFLARKASSGISFGELIMRNLAHVAARSRSFAADPAPANLIALKEGLTVGDWRDSQTGLGGDGRYSFSINAALVPAALAAGDRLVSAGLLHGYGPEESGLQEMAAMAQVWQDKAPGLFAVSLSAGEVKAQLAAFEQATGLAIPSLRGSQGASFMALAIDAAGRHVPVMHSDIGFLLFFLRPDDATVQLALRQAIMPFPLGLMSNAGLLASNPAYAGAARAAVFDNTRYHGTVVWSWQQGLLQAAIRCQLIREDLSHDTRMLLEEAAAVISSAIERTRPLQGTELWSWEMEDNKIVPRAFGQAAGHETESNAVQLWSAIALAPQGHCSPSQGLVGQSSGRSFTNHGLGSP